MVAKAHSRATKLAATFLARLSSADVAAATFRVDVQTVRRWQAGGDVPEDTWTAVRDVLLTRGAEMAAKGDVKGLVQTLTAAGISERNVRYGELLRQREARRQGEQELEQESVEPWVTAMHELSDSRQVLMRDLIHLELNSDEREAARVARLETHEPAPTRSDDEFNVDMLAWIAQLAAMPDEQVEPETKRVRAKLDEQYAAQLALAEQARMARREPEPTPPVPAAPVTPPAPPQPKLRAVDDYDHPSWQPFRRYDL